MESFAKLSDAIREARGLIETVATAQDKASRVYNFMKELVVGFDQYGNRRVSEDLAPWASRVNAEIKEKLIAEVEAQNVADLRRRVLRLEELRSVIPQLAAQASIELGCQAREIQANATHGAPDER
jgi:hypothetical protein